MIDYVTTEGHKIEINKYYSNKRGDKLFVCAIIPTDRYPIKAKKIGWGLGMQPLMFSANGELNDAFVFDNSLDIARPWVDEKKVLNNMIDIEKMNIREAIKCFLEETANMSNEEFDATVREVVNQKTEEAMDVAVKVNSEVFEKELAKYIVKLHIAEQALGVIKSTEKMTLQQREQLPYNWKIAEMAIKEMETVE